MAKLSMHVGNETQAQTARAFVEERGGCFDPLSEGRLLHVTTKIAGDDYILLHNLLRRGLLAETHLWISEEVDTNTVN